MNWYPSFRIYPLISTCAPFFNEAIRMQQALSSHEKNWVRQFHRKIKEGSTTSGKNIPIKLPLGKSPSQLHIAVTAVMNSKQRDIVFFLSILYLIYIIIYYYIALYEFLLLSLLIMVNMLYIVALLVYMSICSYVFINLYLHMLIPC